MTTLALEFSTSRRGLALLDSTGPPADATCIVEVQTEGRSTPVCALIDAVLRRAGLAREAIDTVAVGLGPGSYAGIRVAIAFALGWQLARDTRLVGVSSVDCLAAQLQAEGATGALQIAVDAQRGEFCLAGYALAPAGWRQTEPLRLVSGAEVETRLTAGAHIVGPDLPPRFAGVRPGFPDAAWLARLAASRPALAPGEGLEPIYLRPVSFVKAPPPRSLL
jgi:tRNA threonylcarbamoyladenosine biosynthesis protein TsaB